MTPRAAGLRPAVPGPARALAAIYAVFALAAGARAAMQLAAHFERAPLAYVLSALAAALYLLATAALRSSRAGARRTALAACGAELAGVLAVGTLSLLMPSAFPDETVWSHYGRGYGFLPLVLPVVGLLWLWGREARARAWLPCRRGRRAARNAHATSPAGRRRAVPLPRDPWPQTGDERRGDC